MNEATQNVSRENEVSTSNNIPGLRPVTPRANVYDSSEAVTLLLEMPGVNLERLQLWTEQGMLHVIGEMAQVEFGSNSKVKLEFEPMRYVASYRLGESVDAEKIDAQLRSGVLRITAPKSEKAKPRKVSVRVQS